MRLLTRLAVVGILIISCGDDLTGPTNPQSNNCSTTAADTIFALHPDVLNLVVGSADQVWAEWTLACDPNFGPSLLPNEDITWAIRDISVATIAEIPFSSPNDPTRGIRPEAPGRTFLVAHAGRFADSVAVSVPDTVVMGSVTYLAAGGDGSCAVSVGDIALCWGYGGSVLGEPLVDPAVGSCWGPPCSPMPVPRNTGARSVQVSNSHACTLDTFGSAWCWGDNYALQLGVSDPRPLFDPVPVSGGVTFAILTLGASHTCGLTSGGDAYCWGDHTAGRLGGNQRSGPIAPPQLVAGDLQLVSLDARAETTCGATDVGHLYCWGILGNLNTGLAGTETCVSSTGKDGPIEVQCSYVPLRMPLDTDLTVDSLFVQVSGLCALASLGSVFCFDVARNVYAPMDGLDPLVAISGEGNHTCGLTTGGIAWCWGWNGEGQLGDGTTTFRVGPVMVTGGHTFTQMAVGSGHTCGLSVDGEVWCWGFNNVGQAGTSILDQPLAPVNVHGQG